MDDLQNLNSFAAATQQPAYTEMVYRSWYMSVIAELYTPEVRLVTALQDITGAIPKTDHGIADTCRYLPATHLSWGIRVMADRFERARQHERDRVIRRLTARAP